MGYFLYISLFLGTFFGIGLVVVNLIEGGKEFYYKFSLMCTLLYLILVSYFPLAYYLKNGVWL
jgi:hypothetical protein